MRYLPFIEASITRLGRVKLECASDLALLMEKHEGLHPHQIARLFRQTGDQLSKEEKRAIRIRSNADMTSQAAAALTDKGLQSPIKALEVTLLDAALAYFRHRKIQSILNSPIAKYAKFYIDTISTDCHLCLPYKGQEVGTDHIKNILRQDCPRDVCVIELMPRIDFIQQAIDRRDAREFDSLQSKVPNIRISIKDYTHEGGSSYYFNFEFHCVACGGHIMDAPDDGSDTGEASCKSCGAIFGLFGDIRALAEYIAKQELKRQERPL